MRLCYLFIACTSVHLFAAETVEPQPFYDGSKWGFCIPTPDDTANYRYSYNLGKRTVVLPATYESCGWFSNGFARVTVKGFRDPGNPLTRDGEWGFINREGNVVVALQFDCVRDCKGSIAAVKKAGKWGVIDMTGKVILPIDNASVASCEADYIRTFKDNVYRYFDATGKPLNDKVYELSDDFEAGFARVKRDGLCGWINKSGVEMGMSEYDDIHRFSEHLAAVNSKGKWGFVNEAGVIVIEPQWDAVNPFMHGLAAVQKNKLWGFINNAGEVVIPVSYLEVGNFDQHGFASARASGDRLFGFINRDGKSAFEWRFSYAQNFDKNGVAFIITPTARLHVRVDGTSELPAFSRQWMGRGEHVCIEGGFPYESSLQHRWSDFKIPFHESDD